MSESTRKRPTYSQEFKDQAVAKSLEIGIKQTSEELGVSQASIRSWRDKASRINSTSEDKPSYKDLEREIAKLRREIGYINEINEILKKSTAIFCRDELRGSK